MPVLVQRNDYATGTSAVLAPDVSLLSRTKSRFAQATLVRPLISDVVDFAFQALLCVNQE
jgi:hypothetical protein